MLIMSGRRASLFKKLWIGALFLTMPLVALTMIKD